MGMPSSTLGVGSRDAERPGRHSHGGPWERVIIFDQNGVDPPSRGRRGGGPSSGRGGRPLVAGFGGRPSFEAGFPDRGGGGGGPPGGGPGSPGPRGGGPSRFSSN